jgi:hypothetical protein
MTSVLVPDDAANHLGAMLLAFNRQIFAGFLDEAEELAREGLVASAIVIAGTVLEYLVKSPGAGLMRGEVNAQVSVWSEFRNQAAHGSAATLTVGQATQMISGLRQILMAAPRMAGPVEQQLSNAHSVRGRYSHVQTSSADFIRRKSEEIDREHRG